MRRAQRYAATRAATDGVPLVAGVAVCWHPSKGGYSGRTACGTDDVSPRARASRAVREVRCAALTCVAVAVLFATCPPLPQPLSYHNFADQRCLCCGVPNTFDVLSNAPFLLVSAFGMDHILGGAALEALGMGHVLGAPVFADRTVELPLWITFFLGVGLVAFGSGYYHWRPSNARLARSVLAPPINYNKSISKS